MTVFTFRPWAFALAALALPTYSQAQSAMPAARGPRGAHGHRSRCRSVVASKIRSWTSVPGVGATRAYAELLKNRAPTPVVVAVIDSGIDTAHVDLKPILWTQSEGNSRQRHRRRQATATSTTCTAGTSWAGHGRPQHQRRNPGNDPPGGRRAGRASQGKTSAQAIKPTERADFDRCTSAPRKPIPPDSRTGADRQPARCEAMTGPATHDGGRPQARAAGVANAGHHHSCAAPTRPTQHAPRAPPGHCLHHDAPRQGARPTPTPCSKS
ncbi:MAG: hypothetical protein WKG07_34045 [Hymenobacter sp.]